MRFLRRVSVAAFAVAFCNLQLSFAAEPIGQAVLIRTEVTGAGGPLAVDDEVHRDERIKTSSEGLGQFLFRDGTKLAVGLGSTVVIDKFVFDDADTVKKLTIKAAKGSFRWISGNSDSSAYKILTPAGTIGVRGTAFDFYVGANGSTAVVLLGGAVQFCGSGGCLQLTKRCDGMLAKTNGAMSKVSQVSRELLRTLGNQQAMPFLSGDQQLYGRMASVGGGGCGLAVAKQSQPGTGSSPRNRDAPSPAPQSPQAPAAPRAQEAPARAEAPASAPDTPGAPSDPGSPDAPHDHHHGHGRHDHGWDHRGWGRHGWGHDGWGRGGWGRDGWGHAGWGHAGWQRGGYRNGAAGGADADGGPGGRPGRGPMGYGGHHR